MDIEKIIVDRISELLLKEDAASSKSKKPAPAPAPKPAPKPAPAPAQKPADDSAKTRKPSGPAPASTRDFTRRAEREPQSLLRDLRAKEPSNKDKVDGSIEVLRSAIKNYDDLARVFSKVSAADSGVKLDLVIMLDGDPTINANYCSRYAAAIVYAAAKLGWIDADLGKISPEWEGPDSKRVFVKFR